MTDSVFTPGSQTLCHEHEIDHLVRPGAVDTLGKDADLVAVVLGAVGTEHVGLRVEDVVLALLQPPDGVRIERAELAVVELFATQVGVAFRELVRVLDLTHGLAVARGFARAGHYRPVRPPVLDGRAVEHVGLEVEIPLHHLPRPDLKVPVAHGLHAPDQHAADGVAREGARVRRAERVPLRREVRQVLDLAHDLGQVRRVLVPEKLADLGVRRARHELPQLVLELEEVEARVRGRVQAQQRLLRLLAHVPEVAHDGGVRARGHDIAAAFVQGVARVQHEVVLVHAVLHAVNVQVVARVARLGTPRHHLVLVHLARHDVLGGGVEARAGSRREPGKRVWSGCHLPAARNCLI